MATIADLLIKLGIQDDASRGLSEFEHKTDEAGAHTKSFGSVAKEAHEGIVKSLGKVAMAAGITGAAFEAGEFVKGGIEAAEGLEKAHESLYTAIEKTGGKVDELGPQLDKTAKDAAEFGISQEDATKALSQATLMTGGAAAGQRAYEEAILLSKGAHISFASALRATAKGQDGVMGGLTRYGVVLKKGATGVQQLAAIQKVWGGQAAANTLDSDRLTAKFKNMQASLGSFILPYFLKFTVYMGDAIDGLVSLAHWVGRNSDVIAPLAAAIGAVVAAIVIYKTVTGLWTMATELATTAQVALNVAMDANPIGLVVLALVALGAALAVLWVKSDTFRKSVEAAWTMLKSSTVAVWDAIKDFLVKWWPVLLAGVTGGMSLVVAFVIDHWNTVKSVTSTIWNALKGIVMGAVAGVHAAVEGFSAVVSTVKTIIEGVRTAFSTVFNGLAAIVKAAVGGVSAGIGALRAAFAPVLDVLNTVIGVAGQAASAIDRIVSAASKASGVVGSVKGVLGHIPGFASGVSNFGGGMALVGENGPELVNLPRGSDVITNDQTKRMLGGGGNAPLIGHVTVQNEVDVEVLARRVARVLAFQNGR